MTGPNPGLGGATVPAFGEAVAYWGRLGWVSFGGPAGQISLMHVELVERRRWISEEDFLRGLNWCMLLPGPEAHQLAIYLGWLLHGYPGAVAAGLLFVLPAVMLMFVLAWLHVTVGGFEWVQSLFSGFRVGVTAVVIVAMARMGMRMLGSWELRWLALGGLVLLAAGIGVPWVLVGAGAWCAWRSGAGVGSDRPDLPGSGAGASGGGEGAPWVRDSLKVAGLVLGLWFLPLLISWVWLGPDHRITGLGLLASKTAVITFGGAYAILPYVADSLVHGQAWLTPAQVMDGLALAESTPGPLVIVLQFFGSLAAHGAPGDFSPGLALVAGGAMVSWNTFLPAFLWISVTAPHLRVWLRAGRWTAAVRGAGAISVALMAQLTFWLGSQVLFTPEGAARWLELGGVFVCLGLMIWRRVPGHLIVAGAGLAWLVYGWAT